MSTSVQRNEKLKLTIIFLILVSFLASVSGCTKETGLSQSRSRVYFDWFDTVSVIYSYADDSEEHFEQTVSEVRDLLEKYHRLLDIYHEYEGMNNLCTLNRNAGIQAVVLDPFLIEYLKLCKGYYYLTGGEMNIMMGSVLSLWHEARQTGDVPSREELEEAGKHISIELLRIDEGSSSAFITDSLASADAGAVGKGFAAEKAAEYLKEKGNSGYVVNLGGNLRLIGTKADGSEWITGIKDPFDPDALAVRLRLSDTSCVTSGNYERSGHIIDKDTLMPAGFFLSVSVVTPDSALADALATALFCMDLQQGLDMAGSLDNVEVMWILPDGQIVKTEGFETL